MEELCRNLEKGCPDKEGQISDGMYCTCTPYNSNVFARVGVHCNYIKPCYPVGACVVFSLSVKFYQSIIYCEVISAGYSEVL